MLIEKHVSHRKVNRSYQLHSSRRMQSNLFQPLWYKLSDRWQSPVEIHRFDTVRYRSGIEGKREKVENGATGLSFDDECATLLF